LDGADPTGAAERFDEPELLRRLAELLRQTPERPRGLLGDVKIDAEDVLFLRFGGRDPESLGLARPELADDNDDGPIFLVVDLVLDRPQTLVGLLVDVEQRGVLETLAREVAERISSEPVPLVGEGRQVGRTP
jgi:hypothetical protein